MFPFRTSNNSIPTYGGPDHRRIGHSERNFVKRSVGRRRGSVRRVANLRGIFLTVESHFNRFVSGPDARRDLDFVAQCKGIEPPLPQQRNLGVHPDLEIGPFALPLRGPCHFRHRQQARKDHVFLLLFIFDIFGPRAALHADDVVGAIRTDRLHGRRVHEFGPDERLVAGRRLRIGRHRLESVHFFDGRISVHGPRLR